MANNTYKTLLTGILVGVCVGSATTGAAKDTDLYLTSQGITRDDSPNVLVVLDNSGSMASNNVTGDQRKPYDPTRDYSIEAGAPTSTIQADRIYWSTDGLPPNRSSEYDQWFPTSINNCESSKTNLGVSGPGIYGGTKIIGYKASGWGQGWRALSGGNNDWTVDCQADDGATDPNGYVRGSNGMYSSSASDEINWSGLSGSSYTPTLYSSNYMFYYLNSDTTNANIWTPSMTRWDVASAAVKQIIDANPDVRMGLMMFNVNNSTPHGGRVMYKIDAMTDDRRAAMKQTIDNITPNTNTPLSETLWEAYRYFSGSTMDYGNDNPDRAVSNLTLSGSTVTVTTSSSHGFSTNDYVLIRGANEAAYNGGFKITRIDSSSFSYTIDTSSTTPASPATGSIVATLYRDLSAESGGNYITPFLYRCQQAYIIYVTDGDPVSDDDADSKIGDLPGIASISGNPLDELAGYMYDHDLVEDSIMPGIQRTVTYTVGFGTGISDSGKALLQAAATEGHGKYYAAEDAEQLGEALQGALIEILSVTTSFSAPALSVNAFNTLFNRDEVYLALFKPEARKRWQGNIKKYKLCTGTETGSSCNVGEIIDQNNDAAVDAATKRLADSAFSYWSAATDGGAVNKGGAGSMVPAPAARNVYTYTGGYAADGRSPSGTTNLAADANDVATTNTALTAAMFNVADDTAKNRVINYLRGVDSYDDDADGDVTEDRPWKFGDPMHSRPALVTYGGTTDDPVIKIFVGTNDGGLHMINEKTGAEEWVFYPKELLGVQHDNGDNSDGDHIYGLDGTPSVLVVDHNKDGKINPADGDYVHLFIGMRRGGNNLYAIDVTPTAVLTDASAVGGVEPKLTWVVRGGATPGFENLAQTWSTPTVTTIRYGTGVEGKSAPKRVLIFGGGYDPLNDNTTPAPTASGNAVYIVDPATGERLWWASADTSADLVLSGMTYSIPSDLAVMDANGDGATDRLYVGDLGGQIWRLDLSPTIYKSATAAETNSGSTGYIFADLSETARQDQRKFYYRPDVAQVIDNTYEDASQAAHDLVAIASGDREDPLDLITRDAGEDRVKNRIYVLRDYVTGAIRSGGHDLGYGATITDADLYDATADDLSDPTDTAAVEAIRAKKGWRIDLKESSDPIWRGEKSLAEVTIYAGVLNVNTFTPARQEAAASTCAADEGIARHYTLNVLTGSAGIDYDQDGSYETSERYQEIGGGIPPETVIIFREGANTGLTGPITTQLPSTQKLRKTYWYQQ